MAGLLIRWMRSLWKRGRDRQDPGGPTSDRGRADEVPARRSDPSDGPTRSDPLVPFETGRPPVRPGGYAGFQVTGKDPNLWKKLHATLRAKVHQVVEELAEEDGSHKWLQEQAREFGSLALEHAKAKLRKSGVEVEKIEAEVSKLFAEREEALAKARKTNAEARAIEVGTAIKELRVALVMTKAMLIGEKGKAAVVFGQQIDAMLEALKVVAEPEEA